jgi:molybdate transport system substrate-binding protein
MIRSWVRAAGVFGLTLAASFAAQAAEVRALVSPGFVLVLQELGPQFERATGHKLDFEGTNLGALVARIRNGEACDVVMSPRSAIDGFVKTGKAQAGNVTPVAAAGMGVAVRKGAAQPDVSSPEAFKRALLAAKSISYPNPQNPVGNPELGIHVDRVLARLGIAEEMKAKTVFHATNDVAALLASGTVEIGVGQMQNIARSNAVDIVGPLPGDLQNNLIFAGVIMAGARDAGAAQALIDFMRNPEAQAVMKKHRLDPP